jgi:hypothetical protein
LDLAFTAINSDHRAIIAHVHWDFPFNTPNKAKLQGHFQAHPINGSGAMVMVANDLAIPRPGVFQWVYIEKPGTYTFIETPGIEASYYHEDEMSVAISPYKKINIAELGVAIPEGLWREFNLNEEGDQVDIHKPMFIRLKAAERNTSHGQHFLFIYQAYRRNKGIVHWTGT